MRHDTAIPDDAHLDLGCGEIPRNPYRRPHLYGIDIRAGLVVPGATVTQANLALEPIPHAASQFASVSAFDFIEHVPRVLSDAPGRLAFPFITLMNEIWRVLRPDGRLYALTPCYPGTAAFTDPTHVNVITERTHDYFCGADPPGRMYGFSGRFEVLRAQWVVPEWSRDADHVLSWRQEWQRRRRARRGRLSYFLWELRAVKPAA